MIFDPEDQRLTAFALGELEEDDRLAVEALLADSPEARRFVDEVRDSAELLTNALKDEPSPGLSIVQRIELDAKLGGGPSKRTRGPLFRVLFSAAAGLLLTLGGFTLGTITPRREPGSASLRRADLAVSVRERGNVEGLADGESESLSSMMPASPAPDAPHGPSAGEDLDAGFAASLPTIRDDGSPSVAFRKEIDQEIPPPDPMLRESDEPTIIASRGSRGAPAPAAEPSALPARSDMGLEERPPSPPASVDRVAGESARLALGRGQPSRAGAPEEAKAPSIRMAPDPLPPSMARVPDQIPQEFDFREDRLSLKRLGTEVRVKDPESGSIRRAKVENGNVVEIVEGPERNLEQRIAMESPIRGLAFAQDGSQLMATTADKGISVFDVQTGRLLNSIRVDQGPVPFARFGGPGELVLSNLRGGGAEVAPGVPWIIPQREPVAVIPTHPGRLTLADLSDMIDDDRRPIAPELPVLALINGVDYPYDPPDDGAAMAVRLAAVPTPWDRQTRLVRVALTARAVGPDEDEGEPPVVAEEVSASVEFNPSTVAAYRPIGVEGGPPPSPLPSPGTLRAGRSITAFFEIEPVVDALERDDQGRGLRYRGLGDPELLAVNLSWSEPGEGPRSSVKSLRVDAVLPTDEAPDDVRFGAALAWFGMLARGAEAIDPETLGTITALVESCDDGFLPDDRRAFLGLLDRLRRGPPQLAAPDEP